MGYYTTFRGELIFSDRIPDAAVDFINQNFDTISYCMYVENNGISDDGESGKAYSIEQEFLGLYELLKDMNVDIEGVMVMLGEESADITRAVFNPGQPPVFERAEVRWPDGSVYPGW